MTEDAAVTVPLWLLYDDEVEAWREARTPFVKSWLNEHNFKGEKHRVLLVPDSTGAVEMAIGGLGRRQGTLSLWHGAGFAERLPPRHYRLAQEFSDAEATQLQLGFLCGAYRFDRYRQSSPGQSSSGQSNQSQSNLGQSNLGQSSSCESSSNQSNSSQPSTGQAKQGHSKLERAAVLDALPNADQAFVAAAAESLKLARDLINTPASDLGPLELAAAARQLAERHQAEYREWVGDDLLAAGFPAIHAVGRASAAAPRLVDIQWSPPGNKWPRLTLVGKGVCFDSGGLDIKPGSGMALMKKDMGGAAVALALANMLMHAKARVRLRVLVPAVENSISGNAYRPGDVLATRKGLTVEVGNTDAEGRLVLCDALALADAERPDLIIDFATLTGAARVALGPELPALFGSDEKIVGDLARSAAAEHDPLWPMPLWTGYDDELGSKIADLNNVAPSGFAGAIFGALFLKRFVTETPHWIHIDLYAWNPKERPGRGVGAEAHAVRGVYRYLVERYGVAD